MTQQELKDKIRNLAPQVYKNIQKAKKTATEYDELQKFPDLRSIITNLLTSDYGKFIDSIDWVAPRPSTFRVNLLNGQMFYLIYNLKSWTAEIEGKRYYLLDLSEEQMASQSIARLLRHGFKEDETKSGAEVSGDESIESADEMKEKPKEDESK